MIHYYRNAPDCEGMEPSPMSTTTPDLTQTTEPVSTLSLQPVGTFYDELVSASQNKPVEMMLKHFVSRVDSLENKLLQQAADMRGEAEGVRVRGLNCVHPNRYSSFYTAGLLVRCAESY